MARNIVLMRGMLYDEITLQLKTYYRQLRLLKDNNAETQDSGYLGIKNKLDDFENVFKAQRAREESLMAKMPQLTEKEDARIAQQYRDLNHNWFKFQGEIKRALHVYYFARPMPSYCAEDVFFTTSSYTSGISVMVKAAGWPTAFYLGSISGNPMTVNGADHILSLGFSTYVLPPEDSVEKLKDYVVTHLDRFMQEYHQNEQKRSGVFV